MIGRRSSAPTSARSTRLATGRCAWKAGSPSPDGVVRWFSWEGRTYYQDRAGRRLPVRQVGTAIDITERRAREEALAELTAEVSRSEARRRDLIELAPDAFFLADLDGRFTDVNQAACRMLGYERDELVGKTILDIIPPEDAPRLAAVRAALLVPGQVHRAEWTQKRKDGTSVPVEVSSNILPDGRWQAFVRDITERRRIEDERQVFVSLLENSSDFIGIADPNGKPIYLNPAGRRMVGLARRFPGGTGPDRRLLPQGAAPVRHRRDSQGDDRARPVVRGDILPALADRRSDPGLRRAFHDPRPERRAGPRHGHCHA